MPSPTNARKQAIFDRIDAIDTTYGEVHELPQHIAAERRELMDEYHSMPSTSHVHGQRKSQPDKVMPNNTSTQHETADGGFSSPKDFLLAVMSAAGGEFDKRLDVFAAAGGDEHGQYSNPHGGFAVPSAFLPTFLATGNDLDPIAPFVTRVPLTTGSVNIPARTDKDHTTSVSGGLRVYRRAETQDVSPSRMEMELVTLQATSLFGLSYATEELLERSPLAFATLLEAGFRDEFAGRIMRERLRGTGVGELEGVLTTPCLVTVDKETGQASDTILKENIDAMRSRCWRYSQAVWLYHPSCYPQLRSLVQAVGTGGSVVPYFITDTDGNATIDGRPAFASEFCSPLGDVGDIVLGNWTQYLEGTVGPGVRAADSMHVRFVNHERAFKFWLENDGRCWWRAALTLSGGSTHTMSPFITLAERA